jgi:hypothetical protein
MLLTLPVFCSAIIAFHVSTSVVLRSSSLKSLPSLAGGMRFSMSSPDSSGTGLGEGSTCARVQPPVVTLDAPVDQVQVEVLDAELLARGVVGLLDEVRLVRIVPQLRREEELLALDDRGDDLLEALADLG